MTTKPEEENDDATANRWGNGDQPVVRRPRFVDEYLPDGKVPVDDLQQEGPFDIVVGINARNVETTILHVLNVVSTGLQQHFPGMPSLVVVVDGGSDDQTVDLARFFPTPNGIRKIVMQQAHGPGKGNGIRTLLEVAQAVDAKAVSCVDGDLVSIRPGWMDAMLRPVLYGLTDMVVPYYLRDKWDGVITNHLCYPLTAALYGTSVRQPIGGDYSFSRKYVDRVLQLDMPPHFGTDIFLTTTAIAEGFRIQEAPLGIKVHASTTGYSDPRKVLSRMYLEVVGTLLDLAAKYEAAWRRREAKAPVLLSEKVVPYYDRLPPATEIKPERIQRIYREGVEEHEKTVDEVLGADLAAEVRAATDGLTMETWAHIVYRTAAYHIATVTDDPDKRPEDHLHLLGALGMGRFLKFVDETTDLGLKESYELVKKQATLFSRTVGELADQLNELQGRANPREETATSQQS